MIEPANDSAPMTADSTLVNETSYVIGVPEFTYLSSSPAATSAAAPPPAPLKIATICGIAVIFTRCAEMMPTAAPTISAAPTTIQLTIPCVRHRADRDHHAGRADAVAHAAPSSASSGSAGPMMNRRRR